MIKPRSFFYLLCCFAVLPLGRAIAQDIKIQPCSFNGGRWIQTRYVPEGRGFKLDWSDGPKMTYTLEKSGDTAQYATDSLGGKWRYSKSTGNDGLVLFNSANGNKIVCAQAKDAGALYTITENGIGPVMLGMTLLEAKRAFPKATFSRGTDGEGVALVNVSTKDSQVMVLFAGERDRDKPINWSKQISSIEAFSSNCSTRLGVRPGSLVAETEKQYGKVIKIVRSEIEARQFAEFKNQPRGMIFRIDYSGFFVEGQAETVRYHPDAKIYSIAIEVR
jgi:hypothetical protein